MDGLTLPYELLTNIFGHLSPSQVALVSRVCCSWKIVAFPQLYRTVYLCLAPHLDQFVQRIHTEDANNQLSIATHLRGLVLDIEYPDDRYDERIGENDVVKLNKIIPRLTHLKYFSWNLMFIPQSQETFKLFQTECQELDSVHIWVRDALDFFSDEYDILLEFHNLTYFALSIFEMPPILEGDNFEALTLLLTRCPQLASIILDFHHDEFDYSPMVIIGGAQLVFPRLRRFYARGNQDPGWIEFFEKPEVHSLRQFFIRHPKIEDLALGCSDEFYHGNNFDPVGIAQVFPSLKRFEAPAFLIVNLVLSSLAEQVEELVVADHWLRDKDYITKMHNKATTLPRLRKFGIWSSMIDKGILLDLLRPIVDAASELEEIEIHPDIDEVDYEEVMSLITQVRGLRSVTLNQPILSPITESNDEIKQGWATFALNLRRTCPKLRTIYQPITKFDKENREKVWELPDYA